MVSRPKGKGSKTGRLGIRPRLTTIQTTNHKQLTTKNGMLPNPLVIESASRAASPRFASARALRLFRIEAIVVRYCFTSSVELETDLGITVCSVTIPHHQTFAPTTTGAAALAA
jgi:hypothetical protein